MRTCIDRRCRGASKPGRKQFAGVAPYKKKPSASCLACSKIPVSGGCLKLVVASHACAEVSKNRLGQADFAPRDYGLEMSNNSCINPQLTVPIIRTTICIAGRRIVVCIWAIWIGGPVVQTNVGCGAIVHVAQFRVEIRTL